MTHMVAIVLVVASTMMMSAVSLAIGFVHGESLPEPTLPLAAHVKPWPPRWALQL
jgi:hypothetical protein